MTNEEKRKIYAALSAPFPESAIQRTEGRVTGKGYDTAGIAYAFVTARLNDVVGLGNWRTHREISVKTITTPKGRTGYEAICDLVMELGEYNAEGKFIPWAEALADGGHNSFSEADARKGSFTNALKKAAAMFGCGRQAYEGTLDDDNVPADPAPHEEVRSSSVPPAQAPNQHEQRAAPQRIEQPSTQTTSPAAPAPRPTPLPSNQASRNRLSSKQLAALWAISRKLGHDQSQFRASIRAKEGCQPEFLSREVASRLIGEMSAALGNGHAAEYERQPGQEG